MLPKVQMSGDMDVPHPELFSDSLIAAISLHAVLSGGDLLILTTLLLLHFDVSENFKTKM